MYFEEDADQYTAMSYLADVLVATPQKVLSLQQRTFAF